MGEGIGVNPVGACGGVCARPWPGRRGHGWWRMQVTRGVTSSCPSPTVLGAAERRCVAALRRRLPDTCPDTHSQTMLQSRMIASPPLSRCCYCCSLCQPRQGLHRGGNVGAAQCLVEAGGGCVWRAPSQTETPHHASKPRLSPPKHRHARLHQLGQAAFDCYMSAGCAGPRWLYW